MTDEEKKETTPSDKEKVDAQAEESKEKSKEDEEEEGAKSEDGSEDKSEEEPSQDADYWKKIAQENQDAREKAEKALAGKRFKKSEAKRKGEAEEEVDADEEEESEEDKPMTRAEFNVALAQERALVEKRVLAGETLRIARSLSESEEETSAIVAIYNNRIFPENLTHEQKVIESFYIAHGPRLTGKILELRRSLNSKTTKKTSGSENVHHDAPKAGEPKLSSQDKAEYDRLGFKWTGKQWEKKTSDGRVLIKDPKTGKVTRFKK